MSIVVLDRDRYYGSALVNAITALRTPHGARQVSEPKALMHFLESEPTGIVVADEGSFPSREVLCEVVSSHAGAQFVIIVDTIGPAGVSYLREGAGAIVPRSEALNAIGPAVLGVMNAMSVVPQRLVRYLLWHWRFTARAAEQGTVLAQLTNREEDILELLVSGHDAARIAEELHLSIHTVRSHLKSIFRKLDVHSTLEAVLIAVGAGLASGQPSGDRGRQD